MKLQRDPLCEPCLKRGVTRPATIVHHVETIESRPDRALDQTNLESVCAPCHNRKHPEKGHR